MADVGKILIIPRGDFDPNETYYILDVVRYNNMTFMARVNNLTNIAPPLTATSNANWMFLVRDGGGATTLGSLQDVNVVTATDGQFLKYIDDGTNPPMWVPDDAAAALAELTDVDYSTPPVTNQILKYDGTYWVPEFGGSGHIMRPDPAVDLKEETVVDVVNAADGTNDEVSSLYGIQKWSNKKTFRVVYESTQAHPIGHTGVGEWKDYLDEPTAADEASWGWWYHEIFKYLDNAIYILTTEEPADWSTNYTDYFTKSGNTYVPVPSGASAPTWVGNTYYQRTETTGYDVDIEFGFDPNGGEPITLGGYIVDTATGYMCIKFANYVVDPSKAKIAVDITFTRNDVSAM